MRVKTRTNTKKFLRKTKQGNITSLGHAGAALRLAARGSIKRRKGPAPAGSPPHTRRGQLKRAIAYSVVKEEGRVLIGPQAQVVGQAGKAHEFGGQYRKEHFPKRAFMGPALERIRPRLPKFWAGSVK